VDRPACLHAGEVIVRESGIDRGAVALACLASVPFISLGTVLLSQLSDALHETGRNILVIPALLLSFSGGEVSMSPPNAFAVIPWTFAILAVGAVVWQAGSALRTRYTLTNRRLIVTRGNVPYGTGETLLYQVCGVHASTWGPGAILDCGSVRVESGHAADSVRLSLVSDPRGWSEAVSDAVSAAKSSAQPRACCTPPRLSL